MKRVIFLFSIVILFSGPVSCLPHRPSTSAVKRQPGGVIRQISTRQKYIALTFDDGPDPKFTPQILAVLKKHKASATFFLLGRHVERHPQIAAQIVKNGHEAGVHAYTHVFLNRLPAAQAEIQISRGYHTIYRATGQKPALFRPPYGFYNKNVLIIAGQKKMQIVLWTAAADTCDYKNPGVNKIVKRVLANARPGMIVLLHDCGGNRTETVQAVDQIISKLKARGFRFATVGHILKER